MAERPVPEHDPIVTKSYALHYMVAVAVLTGTLVWGLWDEHFTMRPWKRYQNEFAARYVSYLDRVRTESAQSEEEIKQSAAYRKLDEALTAAEAEAAPRLKEIRDELAKVNLELERVQLEFTDRRARVNAIIYQIEIADEDDKAELQQELERFQNRRAGCRARLRPSTITSFRPAMRGCATSVPR